MKKTLNIIVGFSTAFLVISLFSITAVHADGLFTKDLSFGMQKNSEVTKLQEFLTDEELYGGPITGNFFSLTLRAVKQFQEREGIVPTAGYFGPITRNKANAKLSVLLQESDNQAVAETGTSPAQTNMNAVDTTQSQLNTLLQQVALLQQQLQTQQQTQTSIQNLQTQSFQQQQILQQIQQNTATPIPPTPVVIPPTPGTMTLSLDSSSQTDKIPPGATGVMLAKYLVKTTNEPFEIRAVRFLIPASSPNPLTGTVYIKIGNVLVRSIPASEVSATTATNYDLSSYARVDNSAIISISGSIRSLAAPDSTFQVKDFQIANAKRLTTTDVISNPTSAVDGNVIAIMSPAMLAVNMLSNLSANSVAVGTLQHEFATIRLDASGEGVTVSKIVVSDVLGNGSNYSGLLNLYMYKDNESSPLSTITSTAANGGTVTLRFAQPVRVIGSTLLHLRADVVSMVGTSHTFSVASSESSVLAVGSTSGNTLGYGTNINFSGNGQTQTILAGQ